MELLVSGERRFLRRRLTPFHSHSLDERTDVTDRRESAASGFFPLVNQRCGRLMLLGARPHEPGTNVPTIAASFKSVRARGYIQSCAG
jgi:hypothetical protein